VGLDWYASSDRDCDLLFTMDMPLIPACRGYPWLIYRLTGRGNSDEYLGVLGNREGTTTTSLDMAIAFDHDQFDLVMEDIDCVPSLGCDSGAVRRQMASRRLAKVPRSRDHGKDDPSLACRPGPEAH
jgi:xylulose-5-phosphate/fructose-6-phosphate phosphoketolase